VIVVRQFAFPVRGFFFFLFFIFDEGF